MSSREKAALDRWILGEDQFPDVPEDDDGNPLPDPEPRLPDE